MEEASTTAMEGSSVAPASESEADDQAQQRIDGDDLPGGGMQGSSEASESEIAVPIASVKGAVTKFGGILDWKERRKIVQVQEEAAEYQKKSQEAEVSKAQALEDLGSATSAIDELRSSLQKAQAEEAQAREDSELADQRLRAARQGVGEGTPATAEVDVVRDRHAAAVADLQSARAELECLRKQHAAAVASRASQEADMAVEELAALKAELEASHAAHEEAEEKRMRLAMAFEQDKLQWQRELEGAKQDAAKLQDEVAATKDLESKVAAASELLVSLRAELFARAVEGSLAEEEKPAEMVGETKKELEEVKASVEKAKDEAKCLRVAAASLRADLDKEKTELAALRRKEGVSSASIPSLEEELRQVTSKLAAAEARPAMAAGDGDESSPPAQLSEARREAEQAKASGRSAQEEVAMAREAAAVAKAAVHAMELRLEAVVREILAANTSEEIATASADALLQESKARRGIDGGGVTLAAEEYEELSRRARETEEVAGERVAEAVRQIKEAKDAEVRSLEKLAQAARQTEQRRQALRAANAEAEEAEFAKLAAERELRLWRAEHEHQRSPRTGLAEISTFDDGGGGRANPHILSPRGYMPRGGNGMTGSAAAEEAANRERKTFFPRMVMFLARKRAQSWK